MSAYTLLKQAVCESLSGRSTLTYQFGLDEKNQQLYIHILENSGGGYFSGDWLALDKLKNLAEKDKHITSLAVNLASQLKEVKLEKIKLNKKISDLDRKHKRLERRVRVTSTRLSNKIAKGIKYKTSKGILSSIPIVGGVVGIGGIALDIHDSCSTLSDLNYLQRAVHSKPGNYLANKFCNNK